MYRLYGSPSTASLVVHWMLLELGVPFEVEWLDFESKAQKSGDYLRLNPNGVVPTLIVDGRAVSETGAVLMLLAERHPEAGFAPPPGSPERGEWLQWMIWLANGPMAAFRLWFYEDDLPGLDRVALQARIEGYWDLVDARLAGRDHMIGQALTTVDLQLTMLTRWSRNMPRPATSWPNLKRYIDTMRARPALRETHAREGIGDWIND
ncbi:MAG TPA: glutathione S-transferase family protein [Caulobacter sp.]|nr:glutathione S-transferase family protein [Caulobacter sp.]